MNTLIKILVVEDEMLIGAKISMLLTNLGYEVSGMLPRGEEAIVHVEENRPDIVLLDINLKGSLESPALSPSAGLIANDLLKPQHILRIFALAYVFIS